jgi:hypothetical protein
MGYMFCMSECAACRKMISYNPEFVPSLRLNGVKEAICEGCFVRWNTIHRTDKGLPAVPLHPQAYAPASEADYERQ